MTSPGAEERSETVADEARSGRRERRARYARWSFRVITALGVYAGLSFLALGELSFTGEQWWRPTLVSAFTLSALVLVIRQPQFAALFAVIGSTFANQTLESHGVQVVLSTGWLIAPLLWLMLLEHPIAMRGRPARITGWIAAGVFAAHVPLVLDVHYPFTAVVFLTSLLGALIVITHRCLATGAWRSPRTLIFAIAVSPIAIAMCFTGLMGVRISDAGLSILFSMLALAPVGCLLHELAFYTRRLIGGQHEPIEG